MDEAQFQNWYRGIPQVQRGLLSPNPDDPEHFYDWRGAFLSGAKPSMESHWPSQFKSPNHPRRMLGPIDTTNEESLGLADLLGSLRFR